MTERYGGVALRRGDRDDRNRWGGTIRSNRRGDFVANLQRDLRTLGCYESRIDGDFGRETEDALKRFQWNSDHLDHRLKGRAIVHVRGFCCAGVPGVVGETTARELIRWIELGHVCTGDLVRVDCAELTNVELGYGFRRIANGSIRRGEVVVSAELAREFATIDRIARELGVAISINQAFRVAGKKASGAVVLPPSRSQHWIGHAIDCNIIDGRSANTCANFRDGEETQNARDFIKQVTDRGLRWGGDLAEAHTRHFDRPLAAESEAWDMKYFFNQRILSKAQPIRLYA